MMPPKRRPRPFWTGRPVWSRVALVVSGVLVATAIVVSVLGVAFAQKV